MRPLAAWRTHALPKRGHREEEYEDAAAGPVAVPGGARAAVTDGATESAFSGEWARALAEAAARLPLAEAVEEARAAVANARTPPEGLPWYAALKAEEGAHATALALTVRADGTWAAEAVGDAALLHLRGGRLLFAWPLADPAAYGSHPALLSSLADAPLPPIEAASGAWERGDRLLLATDALAAFLLAHDAAAACGHSAEMFARWVEDARGRGLRNDDVTIVELEV